MTNNNYQSISTYQNDTIEDGTGLIRNDSKPILDHAFSYRRHIVGGVLAFGLLMLGYMGRYNSVEGTSKSAFWGSKLEDGSWCTVGSETCENMCCPKSLFGWVGTCQTCCSKSDCKYSYSQPAAGEWGTPFCVNNTCTSHMFEDMERIPEEGYPLWVPSETIDNARVFRKYSIPRVVIPEAKPVFDQVWYIDFNEQEGNFNMDDVIVTDKHIKIPKWSFLHAGFSRSYYHFGENGEHETGISTLVPGDNEASLVTQFPKTSFVEKYHTLTYDGPKDYSRANFIQKKAAEGMKEPWDGDSWFARAKEQFKAVGSRGTISTQLEAGIDQGIVWQARRFANTFPESAFGSINPTSNAAWAEHTKRAKKAIELAKDPTFEREYMKSEQHCKHFEEGNGVEYDATHATFPLGRPIVTSSGEMVNAPVHYLGFNGGVIIADYDKESNVLQIYFMAFMNSRQYSDVAFPGPYGEDGNKLYVSPIMEGNPDYYVDPEKDGRTDEYLLLDQPANDEPTGLFSSYDSEANRDFTLWARPRSETCTPGIEDSDMWTEMDLAVGEESMYDQIGKQLTLLTGVTEGMPCGDVWMRSDAGPGTHGFDCNEMGVWGHFLMEVPDVQTKKMGLGRFWDNWECFYQGKHPTQCQDSRPMVV